MAEFHILPLHHDAFLSDTSHLGALETGAYMALLMASWRMEDGGLPDDNVMLGRMARCSPREWKRVRPLVMTFWTMCQDGKWRQKRLEIEREAARVKSKSASRAAKTKWLEINKRKDADASAAHMRNACGSDALTVTVIVSKEEELTPSPESAREADDIPGWPAENQDGGAVLARPPSNHRNGGARTPGDVLDRFMLKTGPPEKRFKNQEKANVEMANWLMTREGKNTEEAWRMVQIAREEGHPEQGWHARYLEKLSRKHKLGWFAEEATA